jgi:UDP-N-acetylmuramyl pentapeptide phosphotransferase/UDP-N-acetylglucosamine-1-phosphate transferase
MKKLKKYLIINSCFSALSGLSMVLFSNALNRFFNLSNPYIFPIIGINLLIFALIVGYVAQKQLHNKLLVNVISGLDGLWALGSLIIVVFHCFDLPKNSYWVIDLLGVWIGFLGYQQFEANQKSSETMINGS